MKVCELKGIAMDSVCIYKEIADAEYEDLYSGMLSSAPQELLDKEIRMIGAKRKRLIDIEIYTTETNQSEERR